MSSHRQWMLLAGLLVYLAIAWAPGCRKYGDVSLGAYEHAQALYSICNRQDAARLDVAEESINAALKNNEITERERAWLLDIVASARAGDWESAFEDAGRMMREQAKR